MRFTFALLINCVLISTFGCSDATSNADQAPAPAWTRDSTRTFDNGYIVYVGSGEAPTDELAKFKAEAAALEDLANECSFVPKGARVEDRYTHREGHLQESFAKVGLEFEACDRAKRTLAPDEIRKLANANFTAEIDRYQDMIGEDSELALEEPQGKDVELAKAPPATPSASSGGPGVNVVAFNDVPQYYIARQQIAVAKQDVILSPPTSYAPGAPETRSFISSVSSPSQQVQSYEITHPETQTTPRGWSAVSRQLNQQRLNALAGKNGGAPNGGAAPKAKKARRRRNRP